jgi:transcriptional regulator with XRE-family HTH domain
MTLTANSPVLAATRTPRINTRGRTVETIGQDIARRRRSLGMSRSELACRAKLDRGSLCRIERGSKEKDISGVRTLLRIFAALYGSEVIISDLTEPGRRIRILREVYLLTRPEFGSLVGVHKENLYTWEAGKALPSLAVLRRIAYVFKVGLDFFFWTDGADKLIARHHQHVGAIGLLGERIGWLCAARGLSVAQAARRAGLHPTHLSQIVSGKNKRPYGCTLLKIARVLGVGPLTADRARLADACGGELRA